MMHGRNNGKKLMAARIVKHSFDIINLTTDSNPIQILVDAIINSGPREDATRIGSAGVVRRYVDSPHRPGLFCRSPVQMRPHLTNEPLIPSTPSGVSCTLLALFARRSSRKHTI